MSEEPRARSRPPSPSPSSKVRQDTPITRAQSVVRRITRAQSHIDKGIDQDSDHSSKPKAFVSKLTTPKSYKPTTSISTRPRTPKESRLRSVNPRAIPMTRSQSKMHPRSEVRPTTAHKATTPRNERKKSQSAPKARKGLNQEKKESSVTKSNGLGKKSPSAVVPPKTKKLNQKKSERMTSAQKRAAQLSNDLGDELIKTRSKRLVSKSPRRDINDYKVLVHPPEEEDLTATKNEEKKRSSRKYGSRLTEKMKKEEQKEKDLLQQSLFQKERKSSKKKDEKKEESDRAKRVSRKMEDEAKRMSRKKSESKEEKKERSPALPRLSMNHRMSGSQISDASSMRVNFFSNPKFYLTKKDNGQKSSRKLRSSNSPPSHREKKSSSHSQRSMSLTSSPLMGLGKPKYSSSPKQ